MIVIKASRVRLLKVFGIGVLMVAVGAWASTRPETAMRVMGYIWVGFFGLAMVAIAIKALGSRLTLVLDREGLITVPSRIPIHRIPWDQLLDVRVVSISGQEYVGMNVRDPSVLGDTAVSKAVRAADMAVTGCAINIPDSMLDRSAQEVVELLSRYRASPEERSTLGLWKP
jgi:hypothetical protein